MFKFEKTVYKMIRILISVIFIILYSLRIVAQTGTSPAFVMLEEVLVTSADPRFAPLFYSTSESGEGSLAYELIELVKNNKILASRDVSGTILMTWIEVQYNLGKRTLDSEYVEDVMIDGKLFTGMIAREVPYSLNNILGYRLIFVACYDKDWKLISRQLASLSPMNREMDEFDEFRGWRSVAYFSIKQQDVKKILDEPCKMDAFSEISYHDFMNKMPVEELAHEAHYLSFARARYFTGDFPYTVTPAPAFELPLSTSKNAKLVEREFIFFKGFADVKDIPCRSNSFYKLETDSNHINFKCSEVVTDFPMAIGARDYGYGSVINLAINAVENGIDVFSAESKSVFNEQISYRDAGSMLMKCDTFSGTSINAGAILQDTIICFPVDIFTALTILELQSGKKTFPVAVCIEGAKNDEYGTFIGSKPLFWVPINKQFINILDDYQAYLPGYPQQLTLWGYLLSGMYKGTIISERPIDNAEWQQMLEILR